MSENVESGENQGEKATATLPGTVEKIIKPLHPSEPEKAEIKVEGADHLYRELRIENNLTNDEGEVVPLKAGQTVGITIEAADTGVSRPSHRVAGR